jgi:iron complex outermembrane receptor protein
MNRVWAVVVLIMIAADAGAEEEAKRLVKLGLEDLMNIEVTSVSKRPERLSDAAASIYVITGDEIRRSGATTLPEALRLAPNLQVAQVSASGYAISARGFNNTAANKLLVLIDGRSVYTPLFSGVFWDVQDVMLEDVDRIEVISGPGGTLWGVNAVNGVINVITRSAKNAQGGMMTAEAGNRGANAAIRYGGTSASDGFYQIYGKHFAHNHTETADGTAKEDAWHRSQAGFRGDWDKAGGQLTVLGAAYRGRNGQPGTTPALALDTISVSGGNLVSRWERRLDDRSNLTLQAYYDRTKRTDPPIFAETLTILDVQLQHSVQLGGYHAVTWGAEYRHSADRVINGSVLAFLPARVNQRWASVFAQDEITLGKELRLSLGARAERNDYTGNEFLPNARLAWKLTSKQLLWTAASRTVRAPARLDRDTFVPGSPPFLLAGGPNFRSEVANVYEIGYRGELAKSASYSLTVFHSFYDNLRTQEVAPGTKVAFLANGMKGTTSGFETWSTVQATRVWRLSAGFNTLSEKLHLKPGSTDRNAPTAQEGRDPARSWRLRSSLDLPHHGEFDVTARRVSALSSPAVPAYSAVDIRYGWRPRRTWDLSVTGQNVLGSGHSEFAAASTRTELRRGVFVQVVNHF